MSAPRRIFVLDDDPDICDLLADALSTRYNVQTECDPHRAIEDIRCREIDLLILDLNMPGLTGEEVIPRLRADPACRNLPILVVSAYDNPRQRVAGLDVQGVVTKPFDLRRLEQAVERLLGPGQRRT